MSSLQSQKPHKNVALKLCYWDLRAQQESKNFDNPGLNPLVTMQLRNETLICYDTLIWFILSGELFNRCRKWEFKQRSQQHIGVKVLYTGEISWMERKVFAKK